MTGLGDGSRVRSKRATRTDRLVRLAVGLLACLTLAGLPEQPQPEAEPQVRGIDARGAGLVAQSAASRPAHRSSQVAAGSPLPLPLPPPPPPPLLPAIDAEPAPPPSPEPASLDPDAAAFARQFPEHAAARQIPGDPSTHGWAVVIGVNDYAGRIRDLVGSVPDALLLRDALYAAGWREDHVLVLTDQAASQVTVERALRWLARSADHTSKVVVSFSGHTRLRHNDPDGDGESTDEGVWTADNGTLWDAELGRLLGPVRAGQLWLTIQACEAAGFDDLGTTGPGRLVTWSSREEEGSYDDPEQGASVQGHYLFAEGLRDGYGDADGDGRLSVQEAAAWAAPRASTRSDGLQTPVTLDGLGRPFFLQLDGA